MIVSALTAILGGALIGMAVALLLVFNGRVAGISGIVAGIVRPAPSEWTWRALFVAGLVGGAFVARAIDPNAVGPVMASVPVLALAGLLVGVGTRVAGGCTSGHGVCGTSRLSRRSIAATATFMAVAGAVVFLVNHGGAR